MPPETRPAAAGMSYGASARAVATGRAGWILLLVALTLVWGLNLPAMKVVLAELPVATFRTVCLFVGGPALLAIAALGGERLHVKRRLWGPLLVASFFNMVAWHLFTAWGLTLIEAGRAGIIAYTMPIWAAILARFVLGEELTPRRLGGLALGVAGLAILLVPDIARLGAAPLGAVLMLLAAVTWAIGVVATKRVTWDMSVAQLTGWQLLLGGVPFLVAAVLRDPPGALLEMSPQAALVFVYVLTLPMIAAQWMWFKLLQVLPASIAGLSTLSVPVVGVLSGALLLGERAGTPELAALALVVAALALVLPERRA